MSTIEDRINHALEAQMQRAATFRPKTAADAIMGRFPSLSSAERVAAVQGWLEAKEHGLHAGMRRTVARFLIDGPERERTYTRRKGSL